MFSQNSPCLHPCRCLQPQAMKEVMASLAPHVTERHLVVSIAAGITLQTMEAALGQGVRVVRVMPNTPCLGARAGAELGGLRGGGWRTRASQASSELLRSIPSLLPHLP